MAEFTCMSYFCKPQFSVLFSLLRVVHHFVLSFPQEQRLFSNHLLVMLSISALTVLSGCGAPLKREAIPFRFRQSLIESHQPSIRSASPAARAQRRPSRKMVGKKPLQDKRWPTSAENRLGNKERTNKQWINRCEKLLGQSFSSINREPFHQLLEACLGRKLPSVTSIGTHARLHLRDPRPGDLVLFHNTWERNHNDRVDDLFTDAGVVLNVVGQRVEFLYYQRQKVRLGVLNLEYPLRRGPGNHQIQNTYLRQKRLSDPPDAHYLACELLAGFADPDSIPIP